MSNFSESLTLWSKSGYGIKNWWWRNNWNQELRIEILKQSTENIMKKYNEWLLGRIHNFMVGGG